MEETKVVFGSAETRRCGLVFLENETGLVKKKKELQITISLPNKTNTLV